MPDEDPSAKKSILEIVQSTLPNTIESKQEEKEVGESKEEEFTEAEIVAILKDEGVDSSKLWNTCFHR